MPEKKAESNIVIRIPMINDTSESPTLFIYLMCQRDATSTSLRDGLLAQLGFCCIRS